MSRMASSDCDNDWLIDDAAVSQQDGQETLNPWRVLIVDDDVDVHVVTKFSLSNTSFMGRRLSFLHAYSASEALTLLQETPDVALVLLDVIMESKQAGLELSRQIREQLGNHLIRIVLRTGQPGQALEHSIILDYDINDFWCKTDLTTRKLFTTVISSLRNYASLLAADQRITALATALDREQRLARALQQHGLVLTLYNDDAIADASELLCTLLGYGRDALMDANVSLIIHGTNTLRVIHAVQTSGTAWAGEFTLRDHNAATLSLQAIIVPLGNNAVIHASTVMVILSQAKLASQTVAEDTFG